MISSNFKTIYKILTINTEFCRPQKLPILINRRLASLIFYIIKSFLFLRHRENVDGYGKC